jgi:O-antigen ligase
MRPMTRRRFIFDWQIWLLLIVAMISAALAYNTQLALFQLSLIVCGVVVYLIMANLPDPVQRGQAAPRSILGGILALLPAIIAVYFFLTNDWSRWIGKLSVLDPALRVLAGWPLSSLGLGTNPNVIGGVIAALLPLQVYALRRTRRWIAVVLIGLSAVALVLSETRGAWLALMMVTGMWLLWRFIATRQSQVRRARWTWLIIVTVIGIMGAALLIVTPLGNWLLGLGGAREQIWRNSLDLIGDYPLTGFGLGDFEMTYSTYALLVHVGHTMHAHNLWLDVWLNLGLVGLLALAGMVINAVWVKPSPSHQQLGIIPWRMAALMTLGIILLHTLVDDSIFGYGGAAIPIIFIPLGLLARSGVEQATATSKRQRWSPAIGMWSVAGIAFVIGLLTPQGRAAIEANIGAVLQTRSELFVYHWPEVPIQDALRRQGAVDLTEALKRYQTAVALDPANVTAQLRTGQIELAREEYQSACRHLALAYASRPDRRATRQLLGECATFSGENEEAIALWRGIDMSEGQLMARQWWYESYLAAHDKAQQLKQAADAWTMRVLLDSKSAPTD